MDRDLILVIDYIFYNLSPAAVCQCFTLVTLCTSIADPNWINVKNGTDDSKQLIYGVAFTLHAAQNLTNTVNGWGMWLLYTLAAVCYGAVLLSSSSFLADFLGAGFTHSRLVALLHFSTGNPLLYTTQMNHRMHLF
uniref:Uncharacterized protein n=1 Tax=Astyanax mexicanus TaxID=7994 RepID=A0A8B9HG03_ASTMX